MGCWDITCAISNLPIVEKDPIRWIFLRNPLFYDGISKSWASWLPVSVPVKGVYDEYGGIKDYADDRITQFQVECLKKFAVWIGDREDGYDENPDNSDFPNTMESLVSACERGGLHFRLPYDEDPSRRGRDREGYKLPADMEIGDDGIVYKTVKTSAFVIHEEIYQHMIAPTSRNPPGIGTWRGRLEKNDDRRLGSGKVESLRGAVKWAETEKERKEIFEKLSKEGNDIHAHLGDFHRTMLRDTSANIEQGWDLTNIGLDHNVDLDYWPVLMEFTDEDWKELGKRAFEMEVLRWTMHECRRKFYPALYTDQFWYKDNNLDANRLLLHFVDRMTVALQEREETKHAEYEEEDRLREEQEND